MQRHFLAAAAAIAPLALMAACSTGAPSTINTSPTVEAEGSRVAPTVQAAVTQVVPTLQAAATAIAPTAQALAPTVQAAAAAGATMVANAPVTIVDAQVEPNDATITIQPTGNTSADLSNWTLNVGGTSARLPTNTLIRPGQALTLHTATGTSTGSDVYLGETAQALTQAVRPGARVALMDPSGSTVSSFTIPAA